MEDVKESPPAKKIKLDSSEPQEKTYSQFIDSFFPPPHSKRASFGEEKVLSYVTPWRMADKVTNWIIDQHYSLHRSPLDCMIDGTANIGGNTLNFCLNKAIRTVYGIELDQSRYDDLVKNIDLYKREVWTKPTLICGNFLTWWRDMDKKPIRSMNTCVFLDPPWGGSDYVNHDKIDDLFLTSKDGVDIGMVELTRELLIDASCVVLKLPYNYNIRTLTQHFEVYSFLIKKVQFVYIDYTALKK
jgi:hypothetical protein